MACAACQDGYVYSWLTWRQQCDKGFNVTTYPYDIPQGTAIPRWAFYNVTLYPGQTYSDTVAIAIGRDPEESASPTSPGAPPTSTSNNSNGRGGKRNIGAIVGGVVGGVVGSIALLVVVWRLGRHFGWWKRTEQTQEEWPVHRGLTSTNLPAEPLRLPKDPTASTPARDDKI